MTPIYKGAEDINDENNYRLITVIRFLVKSFIARMIKTSLHRVKDDWLENVNNNMVP